MTAVKSVVSSHRGKMYIPKRWEKHAHSQNMCQIVSVSGRKEGNVLCNDTLNTWLDIW